MREMLRMPDQMVWNNYTDAVQINQVEENAEFVSLQLVGPYFTWILSAGYCIQCMRWQIIDNAWVVFIL